MGTLVNSEDPAEMLHNAAFHQGLYCLLRLKQPSGTELQLDLKSSTHDPLKCKNGSSYTYCINMYGKIHQNTKGL